MNNQIDELALKRDAKAAARTPFNGDAVIISSKEFATRRTAQEKHLEARRAKAARNARAKEEEARVAACAQTVNTATARDALKGVPVVEAIRFLDRAHVRSEERAVTRQTEKDVAALAAWYAEERRLRAVRLANYRAILQEWNVTPFGLLRDLPTLYEKSSGGLVRRLRLDPNEPKTKLLLELAAAVGFDCRSHMAEDGWLIVHMKKPYPHLEADEEETPAVDNVYYLKTK